MTDRRKTDNNGMDRRQMLKTAGMAAGAMGILGQSAIGAENAAEKAVPSRPHKKIKIAFIGGGSQTWAPNIIRDIVCKPELQNVEIEIALIEIHMGRAKAIHELFKVKFKEWSMEDRVSTYPTLDPVEGLTNADFVIITISTGRLPAMSKDLDIPDKYGIYQPVGDTCGPGGWARNLRNFPVFEAYAKQIKKLAPNAFVLNYTNPAAGLTKILANELGSNRVVGLCHGLYMCYGVLKTLFKLECNEQIKVRFGGVNHFFWILDFTINGQDGYQMMAEKFKNTPPEEFMKTHADSLGYISNQFVAIEMYKNYGLLPFVADRHISEFLSCYINNKDMMERFKIIRTSIAQREQGYIKAAKRIQEWTDNPGGLSRNPSWEAAADMIAAITYDEPYIDVVNVVNQGQISNIKTGAVLETLGKVDALGFMPFNVGPLPDKVRALVQPHADIQVRLVEAYLSGDIDAALMALADEPTCSHMTISDIKKMGIELLEAHKQFLPNFYKG